VLIEDGKHWIKCAGFHPDGPVLAALGAAFDEQTGSQECVDAVARICGRYG
jgi:hypothetical protein